MGLLHSNTREGLRAAYWELTELAKGAELPLPPPLKLPDLPPLVGGCDMAALARSLGPVAADALAAQFADPTVRSLLTGGLEGAKAQLLGYVDRLDGLKTDLLGQAMEATGAQGALGQARGTLAGIRGALGQPLGSPLAGNILSAVGEACPAAGGLLAYAENALDTVDGQLSGVESLLGGLTSKVESLTSLRGLADGLLAELDAHLTILPTLLDSLGGEP